MSVPVIQREVHQELSCRWLPRSSESPRRSARIELLEEQLQRLLKRAKIAVIYGGDKSVSGAVINPTQNTRAWKSYREVALDIVQALESLGAQHVSIIPEDMRLAQRLRDDSIDIAWLNTGGVQGLNPMAHAAGLLEMLGIPYLGHDPLTAGMLDNKHAFKRELVALGLPTAAFMTWHLGRGPLRPASNRRFAESFRNYRGPFIVKPVCGRASLNVCYVEHVDDLSRVVTEVYEATHNHVLIEKYLPGREFCVAVCGPVTARERRLMQWGHPFVFSMIERVLEPGERIFTSMDSKPITGQRAHSLDPDRDGKVIGALHDIAQRVFLELHVETLIRLDLRMDAAGRLFVLEANPKPDLKRPSADKTSLVCIGLNGCGMDYEDLILSLLADRVDLLFCERRGTVTNLSRLLD